MVLLLGNFKFKALNFENLERNLEYGINSQNRLNNTKAYFAVSKGSEKIKLQGKTLPLKGDRNTYLESLETMAKEQKSYTLVGANGKYYGKFIILSLSENRECFIDGSGFAKQSFSIDLDRDYE